MPGASKRCRDDIGLLLRFIGKPWGWQDQAHEVLVQVLRMVPMELVGAFAHRWHGYLDHRSVAQYAFLLCIRGIGIHRPCAYCMDHEAVYDYFDTHRLARSTCGIDCAHLLWYSHLCL